MLNSLLTDTQRSENQGTFKKTFVCPPKSFFVYFFPNCFFPFKFFLDSDLKYNVINQKACLIIWNRDTYNTKQFIKSLTNIIFLRPYEMEGCTI